MHRRACATTPAARSAPSRARYGDGISLYAVQFEPDRMLAYYIAFALWLFGLYVWLRVDRSMDRYALDAASQDEDAAASVGIDVTREKLKITALSAAHVRARRRRLRPVPDVYRPRHHRRPRRLAQHGVRGDRRRACGCCSGPTVGAVFTQVLAEGLRVADPRLGHAEETCSAARRSPSTRRSTGCCWSCSSSTCRRASSAPARCWWRRRCARSRAILGARGEAAKVTSPS